MPMTEAPSTQEALALAQQRRQLEVARDGRYNELFERCAIIAEGLNSWGTFPSPELATHIAKVIREQKRDHS
jgi:hypothetical protein